MIALEIQSQATQVQYLSQFERAEALLTQCEDQLRRSLIHEPDPAKEHFDSLGLEDCRLKLISKPQIVHQKSHQINNTLLIELEVGQGIRLRSALRYPTASQHLSRINWQPIYE